LAHGAAQSSQESSGTKNKSEILALRRDSDERKKRSYSADTPNSSSLLDTDAVFCACVFELTGVEDDDADAEAGTDADADTKVDSSTRPASTSDDARVNDGLGGSDGEPDKRGRGSDVPLRLASISAT
jgi:hypothetical protein